MTIFYGAREADDDDGDRWLGWPLEALKLVLLAFTLAVWSALIWAFFG